VRDRRIDNNHPRHDESQIRAETHALDDGAGDQGRGDDRKGALERHEQRMRNGPLRLQAHTVEAGEREAADNW
jgi:hypothetical protein